MNKTLNKHTWLLPQNAKAFKPLNQLTNARYNVTHNLHIRIEYIIKSAN